MNTRLQNPIAMIAVQSSLLEYVVKRVGEDHIRQAKNWLFYDQRIEFIDDVINRYWSDQLLHDAVENIVVTITDQLLAMRAEAVSALTRSKAIGSVT
ncbi:MAG: hypothetical protein WDN47_00230 [Candidatus Doudnabacteria bacterium]